MKNDQFGSNPKKIRPVRDEGPTSRYVDAEITESGDLLISAQVWERSLRRCSVTVTMNGGCLSGRRTRTRSCSHSLKKF